MISETNRFLERVNNWVFIDAATSTGICLVRDGSVELQTIVVDKKSRREHALYRFMKDLILVLKRMDVRTVCIEDYPAHARGAGLHRLVEIGTCARLAAVETYGLVVALNPSLWKSVTFAGKKTNKEQKLDYIYRTETLTGVRVDNVDEADALLMAYATETILSDRSRFTPGMQTFRQAVHAAMNGR